jgi:endonuclease YncB( thermonuclease family)
MGDVKKLFTYLYRRKFIMPFKMASHYTYKGKPLPPSAYDKSQGYFSLLSSKQIKAASRVGHKAVDVATITGVGAGPYIFGSVTTHLPEFYLENRIIAITGPVAELQPPVSRPPALHPPTSGGGPSGGLIPPPVRMPAVPMITKSGLQPLTRKCHPQQAEAYAGKSSDVESLPDMTLAQMCDFHFSGLTGKGKVISVIDGDTLRMCIYVSLLQMAAGQEVKVGRMSKARMERKFPIIGSGTGTGTGSGFFTVLKIRLMGVDTAEKCTPQGKLAKELTIEKYKSLKNIVYYRLHGQDKYGRTLADLYEDPQHSIGLNAFLVGKQFGTLGTIAVFYAGGTKDTYMKRLCVQEAVVKAADVDCESDETLILDI